MKRDRKSAGVVVTASGSTIPRRPGRTPHPGGRIRLARYAARAAAELSRRLRGGSGTVIAGRVLQVVAPEAVATLASGRDVTLVSGTNGKTSITALMVAALDDGRSVISNREGANTAAGIAGTLARAGDGRVVLEVDEGWLPWAIRETAPGIVILSNLSRDQLSRHHEVGALAASWRAALAGVPLVVANADDPAVVWAALAARRQIWVAAGARWTADSLVCPACGGRCRQSAPGQGRGWGCDSCGLRRPHPNWALDGDALVGAEVRVPLELDLPGRFNLANAALALAAAATDSIDPRAAVTRVRDVHAVAGRYQRTRFRGHDLRILLAKNPAGWLELLELMAPDTHPVVLLFNADGVDGRDPSWLYDVSFTPLRGRLVVVQGRRATDLLVRLELDGVEARSLPGTLAAALWEIPSGRVDVVGNYTAFQHALKEVRHG
jgi:lipid II isoglutaminyl synthase (glutamine-hydrolysing)